MAVKLCFNPDPKAWKIALFCILIFLNSLLTPIYQILQGGKMPTEIDYYTALVGAIINVVLFLMTFLGVKPPEQPPRKKS